MTERLNKTFKLQKRTIDIIEALKEYEQYTLSIIVERAVDEYVNSRGYSLTRNGKIKSKS